MIRLAGPNDHKSVCPHCGDQWSARREYCPRCGGPVGHIGLDPLKHPFHIGLGKVTVRTKLIIRLGVAVIGCVSFLSGLLLCYGGWLDPQNMDVIQVWISRIGGPALILHGLTYTWLPFSRPKSRGQAKIIPFPQRLRLSPQSNKE